MYTLQVPAAPQLANGGLVDAEQFACLDSVKQAWFPHPEFDWPCSLRLDSIEALASQLADNVPKEIDNGGWNNNCFSSSHVLTEPANPQV